MPHLLPILLAATLAGSVLAQPPPVSPSSAYVEKWLAAPAKAGVYAGLFPRFRFTDHLAAAIADHDMPLVAALLPLLREANEAEITLLRLELAAAGQQAEAAQTVAAKLDELIRLLAERPLAGAPDQIEREALAGSALRFHAAAASSRAAIPAITRRLGRLGAGDGAALSLTPPPALPDLDPATFAARSPVLAVLRMIAERRLSTLAGLPHATAPVEAVFPAAGDFPEPVIVRLGGRDPLSTDTRETLGRDDRAVLEEAIARRLDAIRALRVVAAALPADRIRAMAETAALAERQFRQGAIPVALFLESQQSWLETLETRNDAILDLWREVLELQSLVGRAAAPAEPASNTP